MEEIFMIGEKIFCVICKGEIGEDTIYSAKKNGDLMCVSCISLTIEVILNLLDSGDIAKFVDRYKKHKRFKKK
jgi:hypothetical protein